MPDKWYETSARSSCTGVSLRWVAGAVDDTLIHVLSGAIEVTALKYGLRLNSGISAIDLTPYPD